MLCRVTPLSFVAPPGGEPNTQASAILQRYNATAYDVLRLVKSDDAQEDTSMSTLPIALMDSGKSNTLDAGTLPMSAEIEFNGFIHRVIRRDGYEVYSGTLVNNLTFVFRADDLPNLLAELDVRYGITYSLAAWLPVHYPNRGAIH